VSGAKIQHVEAGALAGRPLRYFDYVMAAFVTILLLSNVIGAGKVTVASLARFDALDVQVQDVHQRGAGETLLIWVAVSGAAAFVWSRLV
jgi:hypothetical protein